MTVSCWTEGTNIIELTPERANAYVNGRTLATIARSCLQIAHNQNISRLAEFIEDWAYLESQLVNLAGTDTRPASDIERLHLARVH